MRTMLAVAALVVAAFPAQAQNCMPGEEEEVFGALAEKHGERPLFRAKLPNGAELVMLANQTTGTWTMIVVPPVPGLICAGGSGTDFKPATVKRKGAPS